ncbi:hypothetical protein SCHPADRAFT_832009, partial [Schizopora paradoxa]
LSITAFLYYDHIATFPQEVRTIWGRKLTFVNLLFLINRYTTFFGYIPIVYFIFNNPDAIVRCSLHSCLHRDLIFGSGVSSYFVGLLMTSFFNATIATLRCYAIFSRNRWILAFVSIMGLVVVILSVVRTRLLQSRRLKPMFHVRGPSWILCIAFDGVVFGLTAYRTVQLRRNRSRNGGCDSLTGLILRDGE